MRKIYFSPATEKVKVCLFNSVLEDSTSYGPYSHVTAGGDDSGFGDAKENSEILFDDDAFGDIWGDPNAGNDPYDLWGE